MHPNANPSQLKVACIVQGDLRVPVGPILAELAKHCNTVILSTWDDQTLALPQDHGACHVILNAKPFAAGLTNRNFQRKSTAAGLALAEKLGCTHVLKWRTDMLPTRLNLDDLLAWSRFPAHVGFPGRIVMSAFRNLSMRPDWFSSFPDHFAFGEIEALKLLWGDEGFDYSRPYNLPYRMIEELGLTFTAADQLVFESKVYDPAIVFDAHVELYASFKDRWQQATGRPWTHREIARDLLYMIDHQRLGICWLKTAGYTRYRSILRATAVPWWTEKRWRQHRPPVILDAGHVFTFWDRSIGRWLSNLQVYREMALQLMWHTFYSSHHVKK